MNFPLGCLKLTLKSQLKRHFEIETVRRTLKSKCKMNLKIGHVTELYNRNLQGTLKPKSKTNFKTKM